MALVNDKNESIEDIIRREGVYASVTSGVSMRPLFRTHRDMVILEIPNKRPEKYDVVLYKVGEKYLLHRIVGVDEKRETFIIRGDNTYRREQMPFSSIIAVLTSFNRKGKSHSVSDRSYRIYSVIWTAIYPIRYIFGKGRLFLGGVYRALFGKNKKSKRG